MKSPSLFPFLLHSFPKSLISHSVYSPLSPALTPPFPLCNSLPLCPPLLPVSSSPPCVLLSSLRPPLLSVFSSPPSLLLPPSSSLSSSLSPLLPLLLHLPSSLSPPPPFLLFLPLSSSSSLSPPPSLLLFLPLSSSSALSPPPSLFLLPLSSSLSLPPSSLRLLPLFSSLFLPSSFRFALSPSPTFPYIPFLSIFPSLPNTNGHWRSITIFLKL